MRCQFCIGGTIIKQWGFDGPEAACLQCGRPAGTIPEPMPLVRAEPRGFVCPECGREKPSQSSLNGHQMMHRAVAL